MDYRTTKKKILRSLGDLLLVPLVNVLCSTVRVVEINKPLINSGDVNCNYIFAFWHGTMLIPWFQLKEFYPSTIISQSKDGSLLAKILKVWNYEVKRGSSSRDGKIVLEELISSAIDSKSIAITPDGPKGPERKMKAGAVIISKKTGIPIILTGAFYKRKFRLNSWDNFEIPWFFSHAVIVYSDPIYIDKDLTYEETDNMIKSLSRKLNELQFKAEREY